MSSVIASASAENFSRRVVQRSGFPPVKPVRTFPRQILENRLTRPYPPVASAASPFATSHATPRFIPPLQRGRWSWHCFSTLPETRSGFADLITGNSSRALTSGKPTSSCLKLLKSWGPTVPCVCGDAAPPPPPPPWFPPHPRGKTNTNTTSGGQSNCFRPVYRSRKTEKVFPYTSPRDPTAVFRHLVSRNHERRYRRWTFACLSGPMVFGYLVDATFARYAPSNYCA